MSVRGDKKSSSSKTSSSSSKSKSTKPEEKKEKEKDKISLPKQEDKKVSTGKSTSRTKDSSRDKESSKESSRKSSDHPKKSSKEVKTSDHTTSQETLQKLKEREEEIVRLKEQIEELKKGGVAKPEVVDQSTEITHQPKKGQNVRVNGEWKGVSAAGSMNHLTWRYNPQIFLWPTRSSTISVTLAQPEVGTMTGIGFYIFESSQPTPRRLLVDNNLLVAKSPFAAKSKVSGSWLIKKSRNPYIIIPCTLDPENELSFSVTIESDAPITAQLISKEQEWPQPTILGEWIGETAGGCGNFDTVVDNPQYLFRVTKQTEINILLLQSKFPEEFDNIGIYLINYTEQDKSGKHKICQKISDPDVFQDEKCLVVQPSFEDPNQASCSVNLKPGSYVMVPCTFDTGQEAPFQLMVMCEEEMPQIVELVDAAVVSINGTWEGETAGGCLNNPLKWRNNRQYQLYVEKDFELTVRLKQTSSVASEMNSIGFYVFRGGKRIIKPKKDLMLKKSKFGKLRDVSLKMKFVATSEPYIIIPCTFDEDKEGSYSLLIQGDDPSFTEFIYLSDLQPENDMCHSRCKGEWDGPTAGGCLDYATWRNNPQFLLEVNKTSDVSIFVTCLSPDDPEKLSPGFYLVKAPTNMTLCVNMKKEDIILKAPFCKGAIEVNKHMELAPGRYNIVPCQYSTDVRCKFEVNVYSPQLGSTCLSEIKSGLLTLDVCSFVTDSGCSDTRMTMYVF
eukprot:TRINITY_DN6558_c0_g2_i11.p1 TRINITY_DN6558_c0_g2~~TRINITY_DN6558_c0_g2_i11.p1  ORF type:complete len:728 (+),score=187.37 TRINITY_DN6558_c0_g2_i11:86-2269(+)